MARRVVTIGLLYAAAVLSAGPACALIGGVDNDEAFHDSRSRWFGMSWDYVYPIHLGPLDELRSGSAVAVGYFRLLTADHVQAQSGDTIRVGEDIFEITQVRHLPLDPDQTALPDLAVLVVENLTTPYRALPGFYDLYTGPLDADHGDLVLVGWGQDANGAPLGLDDDPAPGRRRRWGTNQWTLSVRAVAGAAYSTNAFLMLFGRDDTLHECALADGDSGGGAFLRDTNDGTWKLAGINLYHVGGGGGPPDTLSASIPYYATPLFGELSTDLLPGDADLDGDVDVQDYLRVKLSLGGGGAAPASGAGGGGWAEAEAVPSWALGDFNGDGVVTGEDLSILEANFGYVSQARHPMALPGTTLGSGFDGVAPEPAGLLLFGPAGLILLRRRRKARLA